mgnify:FL=1|jgi:hypothetical protein|tara:strand:+ start:159 stop:668 length:510 start_codon:yes stop_codon:yes gene_type:complete
MNKTIKYIFQFFLLILIQVFVLNNINLFGYLNPYVYILFLISYQFNNNLSETIFLGFLLGISLDLISQSAGAHTIACLTISFLRPYFAIFALRLKLSELPENLISKDTRLLNKIGFLFLMVFIHHFILFFIIFLDPRSIFLILKNTFFTTLFSIIVIWPILTLLETKND